MSDSEAPAPPALAPITVPLRSRRHERALTAQKMQHVIPAAGLLFAGLQALGEGVHGAELALALVEVATGGALVLTFLRHVRAARNPHPVAHAHHGVDWFEVFAAGVLAAEALEKWHLKHHIDRPNILLAVITLGLGLMHGRVAERRAKRRVLHVDGAGVRVGGKPFRTFFAPWGDVSRIDITSTTATIQTRGGTTRRLHLDDLYDADRVRGALDDARAHLSALRKPAS